MSHFYLFFFILNFFARKIQNTVFDMDLFVYTALCLVHICCMSSMCALQSSHTAHGSRAFHVFFLDHYQRQTPCKKINLAITSQNIGVSLCTSARASKVKFWLCFVEGLVRQLVMPEGYLVCVCAFGAKGRMTKRQYLTS